jgi:glycosyltransferase involved in cell wall biosynthesis
MTHKTISIIVPLNNKGPYIAATVESVLAQCYTDWELIVVENGSTDDGAMVVDSFARRDSRIRLLTAPRQGPGTARNFGVQHSTSEWVLFLDADDLMEFDHLQRLLELASKSKLTTIVAGGWQEFPDGQLANRTIKRPAGISGNLLDTAIAASPWAVHAAIIKRKLLQTVKWPEDMDRMLAEDNAFWFSLCLQADVAYSDSNGALYRTQTVNCRTQSSDIAKWFNGVHSAVERNIYSLQQSGRQPNAYQSASLMQLYSSLYREAKKARNVRFAIRALDEARRWLRASQLAGHPITTSMALRRLLGIPVFERLRRAFRN